MKELDAAMRSKRYKPLRPWLAMSGDRDLVHVPTPTPNAGHCGVMCDQTSCASNRYVEAPVDAL